MGGFAGGAIRLTATFFYALEFCCAAIILAIYSYFLASLSHHGLDISNDWKAVEGISGVGVLYTIFAVLLTCFLGGVPFFAFVAIVLDVLFLAGFIALAVLLRAGAGSCSGDVVTPLGSGPSNSDSTTTGHNLGLACRLNTACFAVAIIGAFCFLISVFLQIWVSRHHQKEKKYGPSPANNYTSGSGNRKFWKRKQQKKDLEMEPSGTAVAPATYDHQSVDTSMTGTTQGVNDHYGGGNANKYELPGHANSGYHTGPTGTAVNPYGYDANRTGATNF